MKNVANISCVECPKRPNYGLEKGKPTHCRTHGIEKGMYDVVSIKCANCLSTRANQKYKPNCAQCHFYINPNDPRIRNYKTKEHAFIIPIKEIYPDMVLDKPITGGCSLRRPDGHIECLTHSVIIEVDEGQHIGYNSICENRRTMELFTDLGNRPIVFVRINPDSYKNDHDKIKGCFSLSKGGVLTVSKTEFNRRFIELKNTIEIAIKTIPDKSISSFELFYDNL